MGGTAGSSRAVAVIDEIPASRYGVTTALRDHGIEAWVARDIDEMPSGCKVTTLAVRNGVSQVIAECCRLRPGTAIVALVEGDVEVQLEALAAGATAVIGAQDSVLRIVDAVTAALDGFALLSCAIAGELVARQRPAAKQSPLTAVEISWLRKLSRGTSVSVLARDSSYSEREMYRRLRELYDTLGARSRSEALVHACRAGVL